jgi:hypothetical protein
VNKTILGCQYNHAILIECHSDGRELNWQELG